MHCLNPLPSLPRRPAPDYVLITGGESITDITVVAAVDATSITATSTPPRIAALLPVVKALPDIGNVLVVRTNQPGDFSPYRLRLVNDAEQAERRPLRDHRGADRLRPPARRSGFLLQGRVRAPTFDCAVTPACPSTPAPPPINYLAKDYGSFRTSCSTG